MSEQQIIDISRKSTLSYNPVFGTDSDYFPCCRSCYKYIPDNDIHSGADFDIRSEDYSSLYRSNVVWFMDAQ